VGFSRVRRRSALAALSGALAGLAAVAAVDAAKADEVLGGGGGSVHVEWAVDVQVQVVDFAGENCLPAAPFYAFSACCLGHVHRCAAVPFY